MANYLKDTKKKKKDVTVDVTEGKTRKKEQTMPVEKDSYVILRFGNKNVLALAINPERGRAVLDHTLADEEPKHVEYDDSNLVANLGKKPKSGTAFGVKIEPFVSGQETKYGALLFYRTLNDLEKKALKNALTTTYDTLGEMRLNIFPLTSLQVRPKRGKYAGHYKFKRGRSGTTDHVVLHPESFEDVKYNTYVLYHEYAHAIWFKLVSNRTKARWIRLYRKRLELSNILKERLEPMLEELMAFSGSLREFYKELDDQDRLVFKEVLMHYRRYHKMTPADLDILHVDDSEAFASMWPKRTTLVEEKPDLSEYSLTNVDEFFAEAFAFSMTGKKIPKDVQKALDVTLKKARGG